MYGDYERRDFNSSLYRENRMLEEKIESMTKSYKEFMDKYKELEEDWNKTKEKVRMEHGEKMIIRVRYKELTKEFNSLQEQYNKLQGEFNRLQEQFTMQNKVISEYNKSYLQRCKVRLGEKIAYREDASVDVVMGLVNKGKTYKEIADMLNISISTVWRRIKVYRSNTPKDKEEA